MRKERPLQLMVVVNGPCWTNFFCQKLKRRILATFVFNRTALRAVFEDRIDVVWPLALRRCDLTPLDCYFCGVIIDKCYAGDNWRFKGQYLWSHWWNTAAHIRSCRLLHCQPRQTFEWNYFPLLCWRIVLSSKNRNLSKYSVVFFKAFSKGIWRTQYNDTIAVEKFTLNAAYN